MQRTKGVKKPGRAFSNLFKNLAKHINVPEEKEDTPSITESNITESVLHVAKSESRAVVSEAISKVSKIVSKIEEEK
jgi:hypothetical protein